jgi:hypothetical protein
VLPFLILRADSRTRARHPWGHLIFFALFWAYRGVEVDFFYRAMAWLVGADNDVGTVARKVVIDQFIYNPLWAAPTGVMLFAWKEAGFRWAPLWADFRARRWYARRILPALISTWGIWIPAVSCIYALPSSLQIPLFNVVLCFWTLLFSYVMARERAE